MDYLCQLCDREIIENESEDKNCTATLRKKDEKVYIKNMLFIILTCMKLTKY